MHPSNCVQLHIWAKRKNKPECTTWYILLNYSEWKKKKKQKLLKYIQHWGLVSVIINFTLRHFKQLAKNFFISASVPGRNFRERWVRCLKGLVSTTFKETGEWSRAGAEETNCSKNLGKNQENQMFNFFFFLKLPVDPKLFPNKIHFYMCSKRLYSFYSRNNFPPKTQVLPVTSTNTLKLGQVRSSFFTDSAQSEWLKSILKLNRYTQSNVEHTCDLPWDIFVLLLNALLKEIYKFLWESREVYQETLLGFQTI